MGHRLTAFASGMSLVLAVLVGACAFFATAVYAIALLQFVGERAAILLLAGPLVALLAAGGLHLGNSALRRSRAGRNLCTSCGYNLTANVSGTCPECGTRIPAGPVKGATT